MMKRKRVKVEAADASVVPGSVDRRAPRPSQCRKYVLKRLAEALPELMDVLVEKARAGSYQHIALLIRISGLHVRELRTKDGKVKRRGPSVMVKLVRQLLESGKDAGSDQALNASDRS